MSTCVVRSRRSDPVLVGWLHERRSYEYPQGLDILQTSCSTGNKGDAIQEAMQFVVEFPAVQASSPAHIPV